MPHFGIMGSCAQEGLVTSTTTTPNITDYGYDSMFEYIYWKVQNLDSSGSATIRTEVDDSTPDLIVITGIPYNAKTAQQTSSQAPGSTYTIYATAEVAGELESAYDAQTVST